MAKKKSSENNQQKIAHNLGSPTNLSTNTRSNCKSFVRLIIAHKLCSCAASQILSDGDLNLGIHEQRYIYVVISIGFPQNWYLMVRVADLWPSKQIITPRKINVKPSNTLVNTYFETALYQSNSFAKTQCFWRSPREVCYFSYEPLQVVHSKGGMRIM